MSIPADLARRGQSAILDAGTAVLIDIREPAKTARENIADARPRSAVASRPDESPTSVPPDLCHLHCQSGNRTAMNSTSSKRRTARRLVLEGGLGAWKSGSSDAARTASSPSNSSAGDDAAGSLILTGLILGYIFSPWFIALSAFMGCGLVFARRVRLVRIGEALNSHALEQIRGR